jgi:hypothetical protein
MKQSLFRIVIHHIWHASERESTPSCKKRQVPRLYFAGVFLFCGILPRGAAVPRICRDAAAGRLPFILS